MNATLQAHEATQGFKALTCDQVADMLGLTTKHKGLTVRRMAANGIIRARKAGRTWRFHPQAVEDYLLSSGVR